jgi:hypothetical protein
LFLDTALDVGFIGYDLYRLVKDNIVGNCDNLGSNLAALGGDVAGAFIPFVSGLGTASRAGKVVIGENMNRVRPYAERIGADTFKGETLAENREWIRQQMMEGKEIIDIGPDFARRRERMIQGQRPDSPFYALERTESKGYSGLRRMFQRSGRLEGGFGEVDR